MARRSFSDLPEEKKLGILSAAATEFAAHGFDGASLNRIIANCRMSKSSFYYYFDDKAELFTVLIERGTARLAYDLAIPAPETLADCDFWQGVESIFDRVISVGLQQPWYFSVANIFYQRRSPGVTPPAVSAVLAASEEWVTRALKAGQAGGDIRTDLPFDLLAEAVFALLQALDRWSARNAATFSAEELHDAARAQSEFLRRMLAPSP